MDISRYFVFGCSECSRPVFGRHYVLGVWFVFVMNAGNRMYRFFRRNARFVADVVVFRFLIYVIPLHINVPNSMDTCTVPEARAGCLGPSKSRER